MATHEISLKVPHGIMVVNKDIEILVREDGDVLGRIRISRGSLDWVPANKKRAKYLRWAKVDRLMQEYGNDRRTHS